MTNVFANNAFVDVFLASLIFSCNGELSNFTYDAENMLNSGQSIMTIKTYFNEGHI